MILKLLLFQITLGIITYDSSEYRAFEYQTSGFVCQNGFTQTATILFSDTFANIPQLIIFPFSQDYTSVGSNQLIIMLEILGITLTDFTLKITCPSNKVNSHRIYWYAIDDARIEVITEANANLIASKQYPIQNPNTKKAIASIMSLGYNGSFKIDLSIIALTSTQVTLGINSDISNLIHLGYQIILTTEEVFPYINERAATSGYTSELFTLDPNNYFMTTYKRIQTNNGNSFRFQLDKTQILPTVSYQSSTWSSSSYPSNTITRLIYKSPQDQFFLAMECFTVRISKLFDKQSDLKPAFEMKIFEINKVYNSVGSESIILNESTQLLNIHVYYKCPSNNKKVHSQLNKCNSCSGTNKIYNLNHYCHGSINSINIYAQYNAQANYKEILITITSNSILIVQKLRNKIITNQNILKVDFLDQ
ncbi:unnamed protein product [Paramecium sonneborni]|uniref:H-type lectin domain-containing protein n=1 Tax=Paramecium sonneborni TaxID=65129 RepID=A0A8S1PVY3_9CILI|nr:unnamed protein product [Paramecium sonneborni]